MTLSAKKTFSEASEPHLYLHLLTGEKRRGKMRETLSGGCRGPAAATEYRSLDGSSEDTTHFGETTGLRSMTSHVL